MTSQPIDVSPLFEPLTIGKLTLKNRLVMAPMTRCMAPNGIVNAENAGYYRRRAEGEVGLILTEGTVVDRPSSYNEPNVPFFYGDEALAGWKTVAEQVHEAGGAIGPQIWHTGVMPSQSKMEAPAEVESPSGLVKEGYKRGRAMSDADISDTIAAFASAAKSAKDLGFDVAEIHGAHGYLIDQFFWDVTNQRDDAWGGDTLVERSKFAAEIIKAMRAAVGDDFPLIIRISQWKSQDFAARLAETPQALEAWLAPMIDAGIDIFHGSQRRFWEPEFPEIDGEKGLNFAGWIKKISGKTTISVGSIGLNNDMMSAFAGESSQTADLNELAERMSRDEFDLFAVGRALITDPNWAAKVRTGAHDALMGFSASDLRTLT